MSVKKPIVVKLDEEDRQRLDYVAAKTGLASTVILRLLIRAASEGNVKSGSLSFDFPPFKATQG